MRYGYPALGRFGLGHCLVAWARCQVWCHQNEAVPIAPQWFQPRIGPYIRGERDKRNYHRLFRPGDQVSGLKRLWLLAAAKRGNLGDELIAGLGAAGKPQMFVFRNSPSANDQTYFHEYRSHPELVRDRLISMTREEFVPPPAEGLFFAVHIRGGDFSEPSSLDELRSGRNNLRIPIVWYKQMIQNLRDQFGVNIPVVVYSDFHDADIRQILEMSNVKRALSETAITDMLAISQAALLISSASGFARWGAYLGQVPRICFPGQRKFFTSKDADKELLEVEVDLDEPIPATFVAAMRTHISQLLGQRL